MKILDILTGGMPLKLDDLDFLQDSNTELAGVLGRLIPNLSDPSGSPTFIAEGGLITLTGAGGVNPTLEVTSGWLFRAGKFYEIQPLSQVLATGTTLATVLSTYSFTASYTQTGARAFANGSTKSPLRNEMCRFSTTATDWSVPGTVKRFEEIFKDLVNRDSKVDNTFENPATFPVQYFDGAHTYYRDYQLKEGQHTIKLSTPVGANAIISRILPHSKVFDGYEVTVEVKAQGTGLTRAVGFYRSVVGGLVVSNLNLDSFTIPYNDYTGAGPDPIVRIKRWIDWLVTYNTTTHPDLYESLEGQYDIAYSIQTTFKLILRWNSRSSKWDEVARLRLLS